MKKIGVLTSGGDAPGMNAAVRAAVRCGIDKGMEVYGIKRGYEGLLDGEITKMEWHSVGDILQRGGTILRTARSPRFHEDNWIDHGARILGAFGIEGIDNDLGYTDYTIGFDTAVNTILGLITNIRDTSSSHERSTIIEVMGRHCGDLALHSGISGGADVILVPEVECDINEICRRVLEGQATGKGHSLIVMAEGFDMDSSELAKTLEEMTGREARTVVPGYIQRGGSPTEKDRLIATTTAAKAVDLLYDDEDSKAIGVFNGKVVALDLQEALEVKGEFNRDLYELSNVLGKGR